MQKDITSYLRRLNLRHHEAKNEQTLAQISRPIKNAHRSAQFAILNFILESGLNVVVITGFAHAHDAAYGAHKGPDETGNEPAESEFS